MTSSLFDSFGSQNFPSNPTVPPSAPPGFSAPSSVANPASVSPPMTSAQITALQNALQDNNLQQIVQAVTGAYVPSTGSSFDQLEVWAQSLDNGALNIENLVSSLLGIPASAWDGVNEMLAQVENWATQLDGGIQQLQTWWNTLVNELLGSSGGGTGSVFDLTSWLQNAESNASAAWTQIVNFIETGNWSDLSAAWNDLLAAFFGSPTTTSLTGSVAAPAVANVPHSSQPVPNFPSAASLVAVSYNGGGWAWDSAVSFAGSAGSAKCMANGSIQAQNGIVTAVQPGQTVTLAPEVKWSGLSAASGTSPIQAQLVTWSGTFSPGTAAAPTILAEITSPGASATSWTPLTLVTNSGAGVAAGVYTVPPSGVGFVQARIVVTADATAGSVWWNACDTTITGGFLPSMQADTNNIIASFAPGGTSTEFVNGVENLLALVGLSPTSIGSATDLTALWTAIINDFINPLNALEISAINGLTTLLNDLLPTTTYQSLVDGIANALGHSGTGHTWTNIETYLGIIPPANVGNVLGGSNLGADVTSVQGQATTQNTWWGRLMTDINIYFDLFHTTYPAGSPSDGPTTTVGGVRTWYSAVADLLVLFGIVHSTTTPATPTSDVGTAVQANTAAATTAGTNASIAIASASAANTLAQGTIDGLNTAWSAGGTGNPVTTIPTIAAAIPTSAIVGGAGATVSFGAVGGGNAVTGAGSSLTMSWTHTIATGDLGVLVGISYTGAATGVTFLSQATYGSTNSLVTTGTAMTLLYSQKTSGVAGTAAWQDVFWLKSPPSGSKTVAVKVSVATGSSTVPELHGDSMSYSGSKVGTVGNSTGGGSTALSMSASSVTGNLVVGFFTSYVNNNNTLSSAFAGTGQNERYNHGFIINGLANSYGDAPGSGSVSFTAASPYSTQQYAGVTVELSN